MRRQLLSADRHDIQPVKYEDIPSDTHISAIAVPLESSLDEQTASYVAGVANSIASCISLLPDDNPFGDDQQVDNSGYTEYNTAFDSESTDSDAASSAGSHLSRALRTQGNNYFIFNNSYIASRSAIQSPTLNSGGLHNQGSSSRI